MIRGFAEQGHFEDALTLLLQMQREKVLPSRYTFMSLVNGCARFRTLENGKHVHALSIQAGLASDTWVGNALIDMYAKCGSVEDARGVFDGMQKRDVVSWNAMIAGYSRQNLHEDAFSLFDEMQAAGIVPTKFTMTSILGACCSPTALEQGKQIHACCSEAGFESDIRVGTALVSMYAKCGSVVDAKKAFDKMPTRNTFSWTAMIRAYAREGYGTKALGLCKLGGKFILRSMKLGSSQIFLLQMHLSACMPNVEVWKMHIEFLTACHSEMWSHGLQ
jgi:pentatricopeptide repeat protein